jgi:hypothetical protein
MNTMIEATEVNKVNVDQSRMLFIRAILINRLFAATVGLFQHFH